MHAWHRSPTTEFKNLKSYLRTATPVGRIDKGMQDPAGSGDEDDQGFELTRTGSSADVRDDLIAARRTPLSKLEQLVDFIETPASLHHRAQLTRMLRDYSDRFDSMRRVAHAHGASCRAGADAREHGLSGQLRAVGRAHAHTRGAVRRRRPRRPASTAALHGRAPAVATRACPAVRRPTIALARAGAASAAFSCA